MQITEAAKFKSKPAAFSDFPASSSFGTQSPRLLVDYLPERWGALINFPPTTHCFSSVANKLHLAAGWCEVPTLSVAKECLQIRWKGHRLQITHSFFNFNGISVAFINRSAQPETQQSDLKHLKRIRSVKRNVLIKCNSYAKMSSKAVYFCRCSCSTAAFRMFLYMHI